MSSIFLIRNLKTEDNVKSVNEMYSLINKPYNYAYNNNIYYLNTELLNNDLYSILNYFKYDYFDKEVVKKIKGDLYFLMMPLTDKEISSYNLTMDILNWIGEDEIIIEVL